MNTLLEAVRWAPSWANTQCWEIVAVKDKSLKEQLQATLPPKANPAASAIVQAPVLLALCGKLKSSGFYRDQVTTKFGDWFMFDLGNRLPEHLPGPPTPSVWVRWWSGCSTTTRPRPC